MTDVCMLYQGSAPHASHQAFGEAVNADFRHFETGIELGKGARDHHTARMRLETGLSLPEKYDVVIAEGSAPLQTALIDAMRHPTRRTIYLAADETFLTLRERRSHYVWKAAKPLTERLLDGVIAVGQDVSDWFKPYGDVPTKIVHPPISDSKYELLSECTPESPDHPFTVLHAGNAQESKNQAALVEAVGALNEQYDAQATAVLLGDDHEEQAYSARDYVRTPGYVPLDEFAKYYQKATVYVQPSIGDSYPVSVLEAMLTGTPAIVSNRCGSRRLVPGNFVADADAAGIYDRLLYIWRMPVEKRVEYGSKFRKRVEAYTMENQKSEFAEALEVLV